VLAVSFLSTTASSLLGGALSGIQSDVPTVVIERVGTVQFRVGIDQLKDALNATHGQGIFTDYSRQRIHDAIVSFDNANVAISEQRTKAFVLFLRGLAKLTLGEMDRALEDLAGFRDVASADVMEINTALRAPEWPSRSSLPDAAALIVERQAAEGGLPGDSATRRPLLSLRPNLSEWIQLWKPGRCAASAVGRYSPVPLSLRYMGSEHKNK
jgi:hypothetical protein